VTARSGAQDLPGASAERAQNQASPDRTGPDQAAVRKPAAGVPAAGQAAARKPAAAVPPAGRGVAPGQAARLPYEQARDELTDLVKRLEAGGLTLEQSLQLWERGERLAGICTEWLEGARARLAEAMAQREGSDPDAPF
jgi:exodeoxyribonuclease VII small subunit